MPELKVFDTRGGLALDETAWAYLPPAAYITSDGVTVGAYSDSALIPSATGSGFGQSQGPSYTLYGVDVDAQVDVNIANDNPAPICCRVCLIEDTQPNGVNPIVPFCFQNWSYMPATLGSFESLSNGAAGRYKILQDETFYIDSAGGILVSAGVLRGYFQGKLLKFRYVWPEGRAVYKKTNSATPTMAALSNCNIFLAGCRLPSGGSQDVNINFTARAWFLDF